MWADGDFQGFDFFLNNIEKLRPNVVFLGLNRSGKLEKDRAAFENFHAPGHRGDAQLRSLIQDQELKNLNGAYMTDLSEVIETDSKKVLIDSYASGIQFERQLALLGQDEYTVIVFGKDALMSLLTYYRIDSRGVGSDCIQINGNFQLNVCGVYHYSMNGFNNKNVLEKLPYQLQAIDKMLAA